MERLFVALFLLSFTAFAEVDFEGSFWSRAVIEPHLRELSDTEALFSHSLRLKGSIYPSQKFQTHFWFFSSPQWEKEVSLQESFQVYAYGNWNITDELELRLGHIPYEIGPSFVSQNHYEPFPYMFKGVFLFYSAQFVNFNLWGAYPPKQRVGLTKEKGPRYSLGAAIDVKVAMEVFKKINLHLIYLTDSFRKEDSSNKTSRYGLSLEGDMGSQKIDYNISFAGLNFKAQQTMLNIETGYSYPKWHDIRAFIIFHRDTGKYNPWLYDRHENAGLMDMLQWGNLTYALLGWSISLPKDFDIQLQLLRFQRTEKGPSHLGRYGASSLKEPSSESGPKILGDEVDLQIIKTFSEAFETHLLGGVFIPKSGALSLLKNQDVISQLQLTALYKF